VICTLEIFDVHKPSARLKFIKIFGNQNIGQVALVILISVTAMGDPIFEKSIATKFTVIGYNGSYLFHYTRKLGPSS